jgi:hypothetical protein
VQPEPAAVVVGSGAWYGAANAVGGAGSPGVRRRGAARTCWLADLCMLIWVWYLILAGYDLIDMRMIFYPRVVSVSDLN